MGLFSKKTKDFEQIRNENEDASLKRVSELFVQVSNSTDDTPREGFKEALLQRVRDARGKKSMKSIPVFTRRMATALAAGGTTAIVVLIISMLVVEPVINVVPIVYAQDNFTLTAEASDSLGVDAETAYLLESLSPVSVDEIESHLSNSLEAPLTISSIDEYTLRIELEEALESDEVIQFTLDSEIEVDGATKPRVYQWAFQAQSQFHVTTSVPGHQATSTPVDTGIEITFSHDNVTVEDFEAALTIEPVVPGRAEKYRRSLVWVPDEPLETQAMYTVTISSDLSPDGSDLSLGEDYVIEFETDAEESRYAYYYLQDYSVSVQPDEVAEVGFTYNKNYSDLVEGAVFELYSFASSEAFENAMLSSYQQSWRTYFTPVDLIDDADLVHVGDFDAILNNADDYGSQSISMPETLDEGLYFAKVLIDDRELPLFIQSSELAATIVDADNQSLVWVHDVASGEAVRGAELAVVGSDITATTNSDGVAMFDSEDDQGVFRVSSGDDVIYLKVDSACCYGEWTRHSYYGSVYNDDYWSYVSTDRAMYLGEDTVSVFGMVENRLTGEVPETVRVWIESSQWYSYSGGTVLAETTADLTEEGTFTTSLDLNGVATNTGGASVRVAVGDETVVYKHISITEYQKPVMSLDVEVDETAVYEGEEVNFSITGSYFDGTPAAWQEVNLSTASESNVVVSLDENGEYSSSYIADSGGKYFTRGLYRRQKVSAYTLTPGSGEITDEDYYYEFSSDFEIEQSGEVDNEEGVVNVEVYNLDISGIEFTESYSVSADVYQTDLREGVELEYSILEYWYEKEENGTTYDPIRKTVHQNYKYTRNEETLTTGAVTTDANGQATFTYTPSREDAYYKVTILGSGDFAGSHVSTRTYYSPRSRSSSYVDYSLRWNNLDEDSEDYSYPLYSVGDQVSLEIVQNQESFEIPEGNEFLFLQTQLGVQEYEISDDAMYTFEFEEDDAPNVTAYGVLFTEHGYMMVGWGSYASGEVVRYKTTDSELIVEIETDETEYEPGSEAEINVSVTDKDGNPVESDVNISIVDEAFFALMSDFGAEPDPMDVYQSVSSGVRGIEASHKASPEEMMEGGKGGGGGDARSEFVDTAAFVTIQTDRNGVGTTTVDLADNITSWRITAQAYDGDERLAGVGQKNVSTTLPFFVRASVQETYLEGDDPYLYVYSAGTELELGEEVRYGFGMSAPEIALSTTALVGEEVRFSLPDLAVGEYKVTLVGVYDDYSDAIELPITILDSRLTKPSVQSFEIGEDVVPEIEDGYALVTFVDSGAGQYYSQLRQFDWWYGDRADEVAARYAAQMVLNDVFDEGVDVSDVTMSTYQPDGMIRLLEHAEEDLSLTAKIAMLQDTPFDEIDMADGLADVVDTENSENILTMEERAWAYAGMAALGDVRLSDIQRLADEELTEKEQLLVALAHFFAGDYENARVLYRDLMTNAVDYELDMAYWRADSDEDRAENTVLLAILAAGLQEDGQDELGEYVVTQSAGQTLINAEEMVYIKLAIENTSEEVSRVAFNYNLGVEHVELPNGTSASWYLSADQIANLEPVVESGAVTIVIGTQIPLSETDGVYDKISVSREYLTMGGDEIDGEMNADDIIQVRITYDVDDGLPDGAYQITDVIPSGLTPLTSSMKSYRGSDYCISYPIGDTDQTVAFTVYDEMYRHSRCGENTITYYARVMNSGMFEVEPAVIRSLDDVSLINFSETIETLVIGD